MKFLNIVLLFLITWGHSLADPGLILDIPSGTLEGHYRKSYRNKTFAAFEGIPYAVPPIEEKRFAEPQPFGKWDGVLMANKTYICMQFLPIPVLHGVRGEEDCLFMYVYVPREKINKNENLDVIVHIHGGAFMLGSPKWMADPSFIMDQDVIYVTMNYRLGILGFLSTEDQVVPGNMGLKDQVLALKWIKDNIKEFGGNPNSITITGLSAGGVSVHLHYFSPMSRGLFQRGFSQSGTVFQHWGLAKKPLEKTTALATTLNCSTDSTQKIVDCMRELPAKVLVTALKNLFIFMEIVPYAPFGPVIEKGDDGFLNEHPYKLLLDNKVYDVPWVTSNVHDEGIYPVGFFYLLKKIEVLDEHWNEYIPYALGYYNTVEESVMDDVSQKIKKQYFNSEPVSRNNADTLVQMFSHRDFFHNSEMAVRLHSKSVKSPVYFYFFSYILEQPWFFKKLKKGTAHSDDGKILFKFFTTTDILSENDEKMMMRLTDFVTTYARTGVPKFNNVDWKPVIPDSKELQYLHIASPDDISMKTMDELAPTEFWNSLPLQENNHLFT